MMNKFLPSFFSLFITLDVIGNIPFFIVFTQSFDSKKRRRIITITLITTFISSIVFIYVGEVIFKWLRISLGDFLIASGVILIVFSIVEFLGVSRFEEKSEEDIAIVPLAIPLFAGPAFLTTVLISKALYGYPITFLSLILNIFLAWIILNLCERIVEFFGKSAVKAIAKIMSLFLAGLGINFIKMGIIEILKEFKKII
ncbi:MAG: hypothetical protein DRP67_04485 [Candidatus Omnitrophota bacterium]|nr:MAG: hypothetical protein DRP67_04485 [Candidatus Omnitrophota bacterium]